MYEDTSQAHPVAPPPVHETRPNRFHVFRQYIGALPLRDPEEGLTIDTFTDSATAIRPASHHSERNPMSPFGTRVREALTSAAATAYAPFVNVNVFRCMRWLYTGSTRKTPAELTRLVREVFLAPEYRHEDMLNFNAARENERLDKYTATSGAFSADDGWQEGSIKIRLPKEGHAYNKEEDVPQFKVGNIFHRSFREVIRAAFQDVSARRFHWFPFRFLWRRKAPEGQHVPPPPERLYTDIYNSDAMLEEHENIQEKAKLHREPDDPEDLEYVVGPILVYSDSTHLTNFGTAALWPIYVFFGSLSKYVRCRPNQFAAHHLAYIPSVRSTGFPHTI